MTTMTVLHLMLSARPWGILALVLCIMASAGIQYILLRRCRGFGRMVFPLVLAALWLILELSGRFLVNYAQFFVLLALFAVLACVPGAALGTAFGLLRRRRAEVQ